MSAGDTLALARPRPINRAIVLAILCSPFFAPAAVAAQPLPSSFLSRFVSPPSLAGDDGYRYVLIAAGAVIGVVVLNYVSGGTIAPFLGAGATMPATTAPV